MVKSKFIRMNLIEGIILILILVSIVLSIIWCYHFRKKNKVRVDTEQPNKSMWEQQNNLPLGIIVRVENSQLPQSHVNVHHIMETKSRI